MDKIQIEKLKEFARYIIHEICWEIRDLDSGTIEEKAESLGLISLTNVTKEEKEDFPDFEVGDPIYKFTDILKEESE